MISEENQIVADPAKPFLVFCHHDTVKDQNGILVPTHFSILMSKRGRVAGEISFEVSTNAIYCVQNGRIKFNNGYPPVKLSELVSMIQQVLQSDNVNALQILNSDIQIYFVREILGYMGPIIKINVDKPYKRVVTSNACIPNINHNTFSCSHCLLMTIVDEKLPDFSLERT